MGGGSCAPSESPPCRCVPHSTSALPPTPSTPRVFFVATPSPELIGGRPAAVHQYPSNPSCSSFPLFLSSLLEATATPCTPPPTPCTTTYVRAPHRTAQRRGITDWSPQRPAPAIFLPPHCLVRDYSCCHKAERTPQSPLPSHTTLSCMFLLLVVRTLVSSLSLLIGPKPDAE